MSTQSRPIAPLCCEACNGHLRQLHDATDSILPHRGDGAECDHCGGTGLDPETIAGPMTEHAKAAMRWLYTEAPPEMTAIQAREFVLRTWGPLTDAELRIRFARNPGTLLQRPPGAIAADS